MCNRLGTGPNTDDCPKLIPCLTLCEGAVTDAQDTKPSDVAQDEKPVEEEKP